jgi:DNA-binding MarR family transcriptional regulator
MSVRDSWARSGTTSSASSRGSRRRSPSRTRISQHRSNTSTRIASLVAKGLLEKRAVEGDGREVRVFPTRRASVNLAGFQRIWADILSEVSTATTEEVEVAARVLDEIASRIALWRAGVDADDTGA